MVTETASNAKSSRSHVLYAITLKFPNPENSNSIVKPMLYLVDLAGFVKKEFSGDHEKLDESKYLFSLTYCIFSSERLSKCKGLSNPSETRFINLSLHYLEQVLLALRQPGRLHIPYRNSLMTRLLQNSLGGNCATSMIATFSLSSHDYEVS